jgi:hypothetical protein
MQNRSEVAAIRARVDQDVQAINALMFGFAEGTARHAFINKRMECIQSYHEELEPVVGDQVAIEIICDALEGLGKTNDTTTAE